MLLSEKWTQVIASSTSFILFSLGDALMKKNFSKKYLNALIRSFQRIISAIMNVKNEYCITWSLWISLDIPMRLLNCSAKKLECY